MAFPKAKIIARCAFAQQGCTGVERVGVENEQVRRAQPNGPA